jgi:hypothetical protein
MELSQFRPGKNDAVPIDDQIAGALRHYFILYMNHQNRVVRESESNLLFRVRFLLCPLLT